MLLRYVTGQHKCVSPNYFPILASAYSDAEAKYSQNLAILFHVVVGIYQVLEVVGIEIVII